MNRLNRDDDARMSTDAPAGGVFDAATLDVLFPCRFEVGPGLRVQGPATALVELAPGLVGRKLTAVFEIEGGPVPETLCDLTRLDRQAVNLRAVDCPGLRLRGAVSVQPDGRVMFLMARAPCDLLLAAGLETTEATSPLDGSADLAQTVQEQAELLRDSQRVVEGLIKARDEAINREAFFDAIVQMLPAILMVKDARDGRYVLVNRAAEEMLGVTADALIGRSVFDLFAPEEARAFAEEDMAVIGSGQMTMVEDEIVTTAAKGRRNFTTKKVVTYGAEGPRFIVTVGEDVTERMETAAALQAALAAAEEAALSKSVFLANMSHEIRTPLNGIVGIADILAREPLDARTREMIEIIRNSGQTLERLLSDILDQARIESGQITLEAAPFHLGEVVRATAALAELKAAEKGVEIRIDLSPEVDAAASGDMVRVRQILTNLLSNAVKFTNQGHIQVTGIRTADDRVRIEVADTGEGFDQETRERIFGRFQQADNTITRRYGGTGLGLAISRELAGLMGGVLDCEGRPGIGASFWFEVPLPRAADAEAPPTTPVEVGAPPQMRVLVADDHATNRKVMELMLANYAEVISVENGQEALDAAERDAFDLVLMDMQMPVMDGLTAIRTLRAREMRTPIIMLTANALPEHVAASLAAGADRHLDKPVTAASLFACLGEVFAGRDAAQAA